MQGQGVLVNGEGLELLGEFKNNKFFKGTVTTPNGITAIGEFNPDKTGRDIVVISNTTIYMGSVIDYYTLSG
jgi:hypothetical protein